MKKAVNSGEVTAFNLLEVFLKIVKNNFILQWEVSAKPDLGRFCPDR